MARVKLKDIPVLDVKNQYDVHDLKFLQKKDGRIYNGEYDITDIPKKLVGVPTGTEEIRLVNYLGYRPVPQELLKWREIPNVHPDSLDMERWYDELIDFCIDGVFVDGEYWNPLMVYWLNVFLFPVYKMDEEGNTTEDFDPGHPFYCNIDRYIFDILWSCEIQRKNFSLMGPRGFGKSYLIGNVIDREFRLIPNSLCQVTSTNEQLTNEAWSKVEQCINAIEVKHRALKHKKITDSLTRKYSGEVVELPDGTTEKRGYLSAIDKIIYGSNAGKTRGSRPDKQLVEEFAAFPPARQKGSLKSCITESKGSWWVGSIKKCVTMFTGTGGTVENDEAKDVFMNPRVYNILPTFDHEEGEAEVNIGNIPTKKGTGVFIPVHVKWSGTYEATGCPNIRLAESQIDQRRERIRSDPQAYLGELQEYPKTLKEVFTRNGTNIFNQDKIATQRTNIEFGGDTVPKPGKGYLNWKKAENGRIIGVEWDPAPVNGDIEILEHPHWLQEGVSDDEKSPMKNLYVGGCDSIDQGTAESSTAVDNKKGSELAVLIKKRVVDKGYFKHTSNIYVAKYAKRSKSARDDWDNALKMSYYYNSELNIEYAKISIVGHFRDMGMYHLLKKRPSIALQGADPNKASMLIGTQVSTHLIDHQDNKTKEYIDENYDKIWFSDLLEQLQDYDRADRTPSDLVVAMGLCEIADEDLMGKVAKPPTKAADGLELFGYYTDPVTGRKKHGIIPSKTSAGQKDMDSILEAEKYKAHGSVRWIDTTDVDNPQNLY